MHGYPAETGLAVFFEIFARKPQPTSFVQAHSTVTIAAASSMTAKTAVRMVRDIPNDVWYHYRQIFRKCGRIPPHSARSVRSVLGSALLGRLVCPASAAGRLVPAAVRLLLTIFWFVLYPRVTATTLLFADRIRDAAP